jgi:hypothetical protein
MTRPECSGSGRADAHSGVTVVDVTASTGWVLFVNQLGRRLPSADLDMPCLRFASDAVRRWAGRAVTRSTLASSTAARPAIAVGSTRRHGVPALGIPRYALFHRFVRVVRPVVVLAR